MEDRHGGFQDLGGEEEVKGKAATGINHGVQVDPSHALESADQKSPRNLYLRLFMGCTCIKNLYRTVLSGDIYSRGVLPATLA